MKHEPILLAFIPHTPSPIELGVVLVIFFGTLETSAVASLGVGGLRLKSARDRCLKQNVPDAKQLSFPNGLHVKWIWAVRRWIATTVDVCCTQCNCLHSRGGSGAPDAALGLPFGLPEARRMTAPAPASRNRLAGWGAALFHSFLMESLPGRWMSCSRAPRKSLQWRRTSEG